MWSSEARGGELALLRVHLASFSDGREAAPPESYQPLPAPPGSQALQNRYVGSYLLYGAGAGWHRPRPGSRSQLYAVRYADGTSYGLPLSHGVDRLEALGADAVAIGSDGKDLHFTSLRLAPYPVAAGRYTRANASQGETRSHGFFYHEKEGLLGLPITGAGRGASRQLRHASASLLYLRNRGLAFTEIGTLDSRPGAGNDDGCRASCVDWYGNSRPLFIRSRVFALMGYEIVEGRLAADKIFEIRRINFSPFDR
jgi:hypothetical protein